MKKISLLIVAVCILSLNVQAGPPQLQKGNIIIGVSSSIGIGGSEDSNLMSLGFVKSNYKYNGETTSSYSDFVFNVLPRGGYFFLENLVTGLQVIVTGYSEKEADTDYTFAESTLGVGPWVRYYYPLKKLYPFVEGGVLLGSYRSSYSDSDWKESMLMLGGSVGVAFPIGNNVTFDAMVGYSRASYKPKGDVETENHMSVCSGVGVGVGISIYIIPAP
jgi:hypothetical protein